MCLSRFHNRRVAPDALLVLSWIASGHVQLMVAEAVSITIVVNSVHSNTRPMATSLRRAYFHKPQLDYRAKLKQHRLPRCETLSSASRLAEGNFNQQVS
ncbi:uncharacterized protein RCC_01574 [Ramularia collo-cygni]|uniref:Uncharacterized protein n=1 Tax=Ramularia collo-cygni TaxID=112498 RepID=A0A2D3USR0_9PEZI|nr:uncharacterized protein RCC_01574 [Ramularia collo-cygni]CZT15740.1 uncharacterized protein RCC_01574 [Ramularia collo-cygni]